MIRRAFVSSSVVVVASLFGAVGTTAAIPPQGTVGPNQYFGALVNGQNGVTKVAPVRMACFGPVEAGQKGHPMAGQTVEVFRPEVIVVHHSGFTGKNRSASSLPSVRLRRRRRPPRRSRSRSMASANRSQPRCSCRAPVPARCRSRRRHQAQNRTPRPYGSATSDSPDANIRSIPVHPERGIDSSLGRHEATVRSMAVRHDDSRAPPRLVVGGCLCVSTRAAIVGGEPWTTRGVGAWRMHNMRSGPWCHVCAQSWP